MVELFDYYAPTYDQHMKEGCELPLPPSLPPALPLSLPSSSAPPWAPASVLPLLTSLPPPLPSSLPQPPLHRPSDPASRSPEGPEPHALHRGGHGPRHARRKRGGPAAGIEQEHAHPGLRLWDGRLAVGEGWDERGAWSLGWWGRIWERRGRRGAWYGGGWAHSGCPSRRSGAVDPLLEHFLLWVSF